MAKIPKHYHYWDAPSCCGKKDFGESETVPNQGFRPKDVIARMTAGAPPPVGRNPVYLDPSYGVDPLAKWDNPIEEMHALAQQATERIQQLEQMRADAIKQQLEQTPEPPTPSDAPIP